MLSQREVFAVKDNLRFYWWNHRNFTERAAPCVPTIFFNCFKTGKMLLIFFVFRMHRYSATEKDTMRANMQWLRPGCVPDLKSAGTRSFFVDCRGRLAKL